MPVHPDPDPTDPPWPQYAEAVIELVLDGLHLRLTPTGPPLAAGEGGDPTARTVRHAAVPSAITDREPPIWVLTAGDPYPVELPSEENAARNAVLRAELDRAGGRTDPALGRAPDGSTSEVSIAVRDIDRAAVLAAAARHGQLAVYEVDDLIRCIDVATGQVVTSVPYRVEDAPTGSDVLIGPTGWRG